MGTPHATTPPDAHEAELLDKYLPPDTSEDDRWYALRLLRGQGEEVWVEHFKAKQRERDSAAIKQQLMADPSVANWLKLRLVKQILPTVGDKFVDTVKYLTIDTVRGLGDAAGYREHKKAGREGAAAVHKLDAGPGAFRVGGGPQVHVLSDPGKLEQLLDIPIVVIDKATVLDPVGTRAGTLNGNAVEFFHATGAGLAIVQVGRKKLEAWLDKHEKTYIVGHAEFGKKDESQGYLDDALEAHSSPLPGQGPRERHTVGVVGGSEKLIVLEKDRYEVVQPLTDIFQNMGKHATDIADALLGNLLPSPKTIAKHLREVAEQTKEAVGMVEDAADVNELSEKIDGPSAKDLLEKAYDALYGKEPDEVCTVTFGGSGAKQIHCPDVIDTGSGKFYGFQIGAKKNEILAVIPG